jgi:diguanylate cyclase (GGDEF)-like protein
VTLQGEILSQEPGVSADLHKLQTRKNIGKAKGLLHSLAPRAESFCFYAVSRECIWSSAGADDYEIDEFVADLPAKVDAFKPAAESGIRRTLRSGRTAFALPVTGEKQAQLGTLVAIFSPNAGKSSSFNPNILASILAPTLEFIGERLVLDQELRTAGQQLEHVERELSLIYRVDEKIHSTSRSHVGLAELVGQSGRFLGIGYSVLLIPAKRIRVSATHASWKDVDRKKLDRVLIKTMMPRLEGKRGPTLFENKGIPGAGNAAERGYQSLLCPLHDQHGNLEGVLAQLGRVNDSEVTDVERRFMSHIVRKVEHVIERSFDKMTGLLNRSGFEAQLHESSRSFEAKDKPHQLLYFDLDNLQLVNDTFGREAGDSVIASFARMIDDSLPRNAVASRLTGDEFCILLTNAETDSALEFAALVRSKGGALRYLEGDKSLQVTMSVGISEFNPGAQDAGGALTTARMACEAAKDHGRDLIEVYDDKNLSVIRRHVDMQLVSQIQQAIDNDGFELVAQPITNLKSPGSRPHYEILLRMRDSDGSFVPTGAFFSAAERYHLMPQIDRWVVSATIKNLASIRESIVAANAVFTINLSGQSLSDADIFQFINDETLQSGMAPANLCFEVTESAAVSNLKKAQKFIDALRQSGYRIALDDFGAGLSSFAYLKDFNVDILKIDGSFIRDIAANRISESMVAAITQVAKVMKLETVAEYVENEAAHKLIAEIGVDYAQGYFVGMPVPLEDVLQQLSASRQASTA